MKKSSEYTDSDWGRFDQEEIIRNHKYKYDWVLWILSAIAIVLLLAAFQSSQEDKAKCLKNSNQSAETCEFYIR